MSSAHSMMTGGRTHYDLNVPENLEKIENLSKYGVDTIAKIRMKEAKKLTSSSDTIKKLEYNHRVLSAQSQVIAGIKYYIKITMNDAACPKLCSVEECDLQIWEKSWENFTNLTKFDCKTTKKAETHRFGADPKTYSPFSRQGNLVGAEKRVDLNGKSKAALDVLMTRVNSGLNSNFLHRPIDVEVTKKVVAGMLYTYNFKIAKTSCAKGNNDQLVDQCQIEADVQPIQCKGTVWEKVWMPQPYVDIKFKCNE